MWKSLPGDPVIPAHIFDSELLEFQLRLGPQDSYEASISVAKYRTDAP